MNRQQRRQQERVARRTPRTTSRRRPDDSVSGSVSSSHDDSISGTHEVIPVPISTSVYDYKSGSNRFIAMRVVIPNCTVTYSLSAKDAIEWAESVIKIAKKEVKAEDGIMRVDSGLLIAKGLPNG